MRVCVDASTTSRRWWLCFSRPGGSTGDHAGGDARTATSLHPLPDEPAGGDERDDALDALQSVRRSSVIARRPRYGWRPGVNGHVNPRVMSHSIKKFGHTFTFFTSTHFFAKLGLSLSLGFFQTSYCNENVWNKCANE